MYKILVTGMSSVAGGIESVIKNYYGCFDETKVHMDFICNSPAKMAYEDYFVENGSKVYHTARRGKKPLQYFKQLNSIFSRVGSEYDCLWFNTSDLANIDALKLAKKHKISKIIVHSHNSKMTEIGLKGIIKTHEHFKHRENIDKYATDFWACSLAASKWMYPSRLRQRTVIIRNAINVKKYLFNPQKRQKIRKEYDLNGYFVLGNVGRLNFQKNQKYIINIFSKVKKIIPKSKLVLVGEGDDKEKLLVETKRLGLYNDVIFAGYQKDMVAWYSAFDVFVFPSIFEGLSVALLEAQASGINIISSNNVSAEEVKVNDNLYVVDLKCSKEWINKIIELKEQNRVPRTDVEHNFVSKNYSIDNEAIRVENILLKK